MTEEEARALIAEVYRRLELMARTATSSPQIHSVVTKTLQQLKQQLEANPACLDEIIRATRTAASEK